MAKPKGSGGSAGANGAREGDRIGAARGLHARHRRAATVAQAREQQSKALVDRAWTEHHVSYPHVHSGWGGSPRPFSTYHGPAATQDAHWQAAEHLADRARTSRARSTRARALAESLAGRRDRILHPKS